MTEKPFSKGFTLIQVLVSVAIIGVVVAAAVNTVSDTTSSAESQKLERDVQSLNTAIDIYQTFGGNLTGVNTPQGVLRKLQTRADSVSSEQVAGLAGSLIDRRMRIQIQPEAEVSSNKPRAVWDPEKRRFKVVSQGAPGQIAVSRFVVLDSTMLASGASRDLTQSEQELLGGGGTSGQEGDGSTEPGTTGPPPVNGRIVELDNGMLVFDPNTSTEGVAVADDVATDFEIEQETRDPHLKLARGDGWIWDYNDTSSAGNSSPTQIVIAGGSSGAGGGGGGGGGGTDPNPTNQLAPPTFSVPGGARTIRDYDLSLTLSNPNEPGASRIVYRVGDGGWTNYDGSDIAVIPGKTVMAYSESLLPNDYENSTTVFQTYLASGINLSKPEIGVTATQFDFGTNENIIVTLLDPNDPTYSSLEYRIDDGDWQFYSLPFNLNVLDYPLGAVIEARAIATPEAYPEYYVDSGVESQRLIQPPPAPLDPPMIGLSHGSFVSERYNGQDSGDIPPNYNPQDPVVTPPSCPPGGLVARFQFKNNNGHGNNADGVDVSNPGQGNGGPNGQDDPSGDFDDEIGGGWSGFSFVAGEYPRPVTISNVVFQSNNPNKPIQADFTSTVPVDSVRVYSGNSLASSSVEYYDPPAFAGNFTRVGNQTIKVVEFYCSSSDSGDGGSNPPTANYSVVLLDDDAFHGSRSFVENAANRHGVNPDWLTNEDVKTMSGNPWVRWSQNYSGDTAILPCGNSGDEGWFTLPSTLPFNLNDFLEGNVPQGELDSVEGVSPMNAIALQNLVGRTVLAVCHDSDVTMTQGPLRGNLQGSRFGRFAFTVLEYIPRGVGSNPTDLGSLRIRVEMSSVFDGIEGLVTDAGGDGSAGAYIEIYDGEETGESEPAEAAFDAASEVVKAIRVSITNPNPVGASTIRYKVVARDDSLARGYQILPPEQDTSDFQAYTGIFLVTAADYPDGFGVLAYCEAENDGWLTGDVALNQTDKTSKITIIGDSWGGFEDPTGDSGLESNLDEGELSSYFTWGEAAGTPVSSWLQFRGSDWSGATDNDRFLIGSIDYYNGTFQEGTGATSVDLAIQLSFDGSQSREFTFTLDLVDTQNNSGTDAGDADYVKLYDVTASTPVQIYDWNFNLKLEFGATTASGSSTTDEFHVLEGETATGNIYGRLELVE